MKRLRAMRIPRRASRSSTATGVLAYRGVVRVPPQFDLAHEAGPRRPACAWSPHDAARVDTTGNRALFASNRSGAAA